MRKLNFILIAFALGSNSCAKPGCRDTKAVNYDSSVKENDYSTCVYLNGDDLPVIFNYSSNTSYENTNDTVYFKNNPNKAIDYVIPNSENFYNPVVFEPGVVIGLKNDVKLTFSSSFKCEGQLGNEIEFIYYNTDSQNSYNNGWAGLKVYNSYVNTFQYVRMKNVGSTNNSSNEPIIYYYNISNFNTLTVNNCTFESVGSSCVLDQYTTSSAKIDTSNLTYIDCTGSKYCW